LSLAIVFLLGLAWAVKNTVPRFVNQSRLILNIGAVREGERVVYKDVPWLVKKINFYSVLENPDLGQTLRVPIEALMDLISRPFQRDEPWFPCRKNDWVILSDGTRGGVTSLSHEMVEMVLRGGAKKVYQTSDFLEMSPMNLSVNFRLKIEFGISYNLQSLATNRVLEILDAHIRERLAAENYEESLLNLRVEFAQAGSSSLDLVVIADFDGKMAPLYNRISRAIQRWCTDACTANDWEIPFPQLTVHKPAA
jgi:small-conductance mechanosensitive channel